MNCPKCGATMRHERALSGPSGLRRQDGAGTTTIVSGHTCWRCGKWVDDDVAPVLDYVPEPAKKPGVVKHSPEDTTAVYYIVNRFFDSITRQLAIGASWFTITKLVNRLDGSKCQEKTLQKHYLREQARRSEGAK